ncbi:hypothetical protein ASPZODRAFT_58226 [Penicilliopsis zonata CBS 506.65]|uniref:Mitochondrial thiamine pyrophosphate carrier 1 n=1 Tax=Penicilliopsis zonata CBS 506.65 TaxID=1073090 RepID=A0A1L9SRB3_9EURO|nr:hypothetical protein ASPZODRAFT_58226 [Penicilliopsis zonata CBS 506.65]OJJ49647.1 hypothetical protein ASPZODRAFT_58226 [Penicilliopsis zonata CBS 506.65]
MYNSNFDVWVAGAFAAVMVDFIVYPFDTLKTRIQSPNYETLYKSARTGAVRRHVLYRGLYQGVWSVVVSTIPSSGAFFTTYEAVKYSLNNASSASTAPHQNRLPFTHSLPSPIVHALASSSAEMVACLMLTPAEVLKQNAQVVQRNGSGGGNGGSQRSQSATLQVLYRFRRHPWKLWNGYTALVSRNLPFTGLQFPIFEYIRSRMIEWWKQRLSDNNAKNPMSNNNHNPVLERALLTGMSASMSGTIAAIVTTPIDVIKTRVMLAASNDSIGTTTAPPTTTQDSAKRKAEMKGKSRTITVGKQIFRDEGIKGLFRGGAIRAAWTAVSLSMYLSLYEGLRFHLENRRKEREGKAVRPNLDGQDEAEEALMT